MTYLLLTLRGEMEKIGMEAIFDVDEDMIKSVEWFDIEITGTKEGDFFYKKSIDYNKKSKSITLDDLF